ncbi:MAG: peptide chain release factor 2 [Longimicrobiales bacterium]|nr:peptide chain release factor 2 [Longimicrobiales bacterium]|tara:strand:- start:11268 stop:12347 length:1080 start_codon:yes stop_codon:yes gene_type:complete
MLYQFGYQSFGGIFDLSVKEGELLKLEKEMADGGFWNNQERARQAITESNNLKKWIQPWREFDSKLVELRELLELIDSEEEEKELRDEWFKELDVLESGVGSLELKTMLRGEDDHRDALLTVHPGAGGLESQDWAEMLTRMYRKWGERNGFTINVLDFQPGEEAGIKSATIEFSGLSAYGYLKSEKGVHRLVRISPFDAQSRRHTSFASVFVYPQVDDDIEVDIEDSDLRVDTFRASGAGGQHVNKTDSAIRITHLPTGIVVGCQQERSQHKNRATAMKMLKSALYEHAVSAKEEKKAAVEATKTGIEFGHQIRSYVFQPYTMVNDHRTEIKVGDVQKVMDGDLDVFIEAYLKQFSSKN